jgi:hypothetical protein
MHNTPSQLDQNARLTLSESSFPARFFESSLFNCTSPTKFPPSEWKLLRAYASSVCELGVRYQWLEVNSKLLGNPRFQQAVARVLGRLFEYEDSLTFQYGTANPRYLAKEVLTFTTTSFEAMSKWGLTETISARDIHRFSHAQLRAIEEETEKEFTDALKSPRLAKRARFLIVTGEYHSVDDVVSLYRDTHEKACKFKELRPMAKGIARWVVMGNYFSFEGFTSKYEEVSERADRLISADSPWHQVKRSIVYRVLSKDFTSVDHAIQILEETKTHASSKILLGLEPYHNFAGLKLKSEETAEYIARSVFNSSKKTTDQTIERYIKKLIEFYKEWEKVQSKSKRRCSPQEPYFE